MSFVTTAPAAISAAATQLEGVGNSFATESAGAAGSTTAISPAAADEVSILQSGVFSTYGQLYQTVSAQAQAVHQQFVNTLQQSSGSYQETEGANQAGAAASSLANSASSAAAQPAQDTPITDLINSLTSFLGSGFGILPGGANSNLVQVPLDEVGNFASAESDLIGMGGGGLLTALAGPATASADLGGLGSGLVGDVGPAAAVGGIGGAGGIGAAPVLAAAGSGSSIGPMSV
ncbi:MAG: PE family protein, partial [Mycobacterium sp.]|uniref:PE family protein n=1 Tax=Mycobacterium sp. TaxID=1785 RepID=UPI003C73AA9B